MGQTVSPDLFMISLRKALSAAIQEELNNEVEVACQKVEARVRERIGAIAIDVAQWAEIHLMQDRLVIEVRLKKE